MELIFATHNQHKLEEVQQIVGSSVLLLSLKEIGCEEDIPETSTTLEGNALQKARYVYDKYGRSCFADDTGLEIEALDGKPGVYSARYAGEECSFEDNMEKVLSEMEGKQNRKACFRSVIALILDGKEYFFEGRVDGEILPDRHGKGGFGYDPIFKPLGYDKTFSQMSMDEKNRISHRGRAMEKLTKFLREII